MKKLALVVASAALVACSENPTQPTVQSSLKGPNLTVLTPGGVNLLACFAGPTDGAPQGGTCTLSSDHKKAVLANNSGDTDGDYSGVYTLELTVYREYLTNITELSYHYKGSIIPQLGNLSYNIPIDLDANDVTDFFAFVDAANCGVKIEATVNIVTMPKCGIDANGTHYLNWAQFVAAYPSATVSYGDYIFIVAERTPSEPSATWQISNVKFGKTGLICFDGPRDASGFGGACTLGSDFKSAQLNNDGSDPDGDYAGVYSKERQGYGLFLSAIQDLTYKYTGPTPTLGDLSYNIPITTDNDLHWDYFAFVDATTCRGTLGGGGVYTVNITRDAACQIVLGSPVVATYPNWAAFAAANPNARIASDNSTGDDVFMFLVAERTSGEGPALWQIKSANWGKKK